MANIFCVVACEEELDQVVLQHVREVAIKHEIHTVAIGANLAEFQRSEENKVALCESEILICCSMKVSPNIVEIALNMPKLKWFHSWLAGVDKLSAFMKEPKLSNVQMTNARGAYSSSLAEFVLLAMLYYTKDVDRLKDSKTKKMWDYFMTQEVRGMTVGFIGFGHIAQTCALRAQALGMRTIALRRSSAEPCKTNLTEPDAVYFDDRVGDRFTVISQSDFVVCSLPGTPKTLKFCGKAELAAMKPSAVFISVGRGSVVDEDALVQVLKTKAIRGAALDVYAVEPLPTTSELWTLDNVLMSYHNADIVPSYHKDGAKTLEKNLINFLGGEDLHSSVAKNEGY